MELKAILKEGSSSRVISMDVPTISNFFIPNPIADSRWARPYQFRDVARYPLAEASDVSNDFRKLVNIVNESYAPNRIEQYKKGLLRLVDEHIARCGRLIFCDLVLYVDCLAYLVYASDLMTESQIVANYALWVKFVVDNRRPNILSSTKYGTVAFIGSDNERDLESCLNN